MHSLCDCRVLLWLHHAVPEARGWVLSLTGIRVVQGMTGVGHAACLRLIVNSAVAGQTQTVLKGIAGFLGLLLVQFTLSVLSRSLSEAARTGIENRLKHRFLHQLLYRSYGQVTATHSGEWMTRLTSDTTVVAGAAVQILPGSLGMLSQMTSAAAMLLFMIPELAIFIIAGGGVLLLSTVWIRKNLKQLHRKIQEKDGLLRGFLTERIASLLILRAYQQENAVEAEADVLMDGHREARMKKNRFSTFCNSGFQLLMNMTYLLGAAWCALGILHGSISYGTFTAVIQLVSQLQSPIAGLTGFVPQYYSMLASAERLMEAEQLEEAEAAAEPAPREAFLGLQMENICFSYPDDSHRTDALENLNLSLHAGEYVALSGPSGCGKSTVLKLLLGLYSPDSGRCLVLSTEGYVPLTGRWCRLFAYVPQGNQLMSGSIRKVLTLASPEKVQDDSQLWRALRIACAEEFVRALPEGLDTILGERGCGLSEGQMQRLAVARALLSDRPVLLLDEATSALDGPAETQLLQNLRAMTDKTVLLVTHRPAALEIVDQVIHFPTAQTLSR